MGFPSWHFVSFLVLYALDLPEAGAVFLQNAAVHDHEDAGFAGLLCGLLLDHSLLHPNHGHLQPDCLVYGLFHEFGPPEDIYDVNFLWHFEQRPIRFLSQ
jgi:hypothetical protein